MPSGATGLSPAALTLAWADWALHLSMSPGKQAELAQKAARKTLRLWRHAHDVMTGIAEANDGSWLPPWQAWLAARSSGEVSPPEIGAAARGH